MINLGAETHKRKLLHNSNRGEVGITDLGQDLTDLAAFKRQRHQGLDSDGCNASISTLWRHREANLYAAVVRCILEPAATNDCAVRPADVAAAIAGEMLPGVGIPVSCEAQQPLARHN